MQCDKMDGVLRPFKATHVLWGLVLLSLGAVALLRCVSGSNPEERDAANASASVPRFTHTLADSQNFTFVAVGDTHLGTNDRVQSILRAGTANGNQFVILLGDIVDRGALENYQPLKDLVEAEGWTGRFFTILGNHDIVGGAWQEYNRLFGASYYTFDIGNSRFIALDTADGTLGKKQWRWFEDQLNLSRPRHTFVLTHYLPFIPNLPSSFKDWFYKMSDMEEAAQFMSLCARKGVKAVLGGHYHAYASQNVAGVEYVVAGGGGGRTMAPTNSHFYVEVSVAGDSVSHRAVTVP